MSRTEFDVGQFDEAYPPGIERSWWSLARNKVIARTFRRHVGRHERILEVGCGTGIVTHHLRGEGWDVTGVDLGHPQGITTTSEHVLLGMNVFELPLARRAGITVLCLFDVIEHIEDAPGFLRALLASFPGVRTVIVTVPARKELWTTFDDHYGHFRRYDRTMLSEELRTAGLRVERTAYFFHALYPLIGLNNLLRGRKRNIRFTAPAVGAASTVNAWMAGAFALEQRAVPSRWVGSSLIAVAHHEGA